LTPSVSEYFDTFLDSIGSRTLLVLDSITVIAASATISDDDLTGVLDATVTFAQVRCSTFT
jgi:hypothetical protein